ncbi:hypothetical protein DPMN_111523 [Dreissena polymorpha]|uniref:Uncharacterized protein n=1 Tax=Dreissena polymorpha TaxID=45954 RepID=A0A9D4KE08_DREPO|nr:hypothetical protein DPMN_111523 [Dreissena polymorpha]
MLPTRGRLPVLFPKMEEPSHLYTTTPIKEAVFATESPIPAQDEETSLPKTPLLEATSHWSRRDDG